MQVGDVGLGVAIRDGVADHKGRKVVLQCVDGRGPDAAAGGQPGHDHGISAGDGEAIGEIGAEEATGVVFLDYGFTALRRHASIDLDPVAARGEQVQVGQSLPEYPRLVGFSNSNFFFLASFPFFMSRLFPFLLHPVLLSSSCIHD